MITKKEIKQLISQDKLIENYIDLDTQLTPNGFDLTIGSIFQFDSSGAIDFSNNERVVPAGKKINPNKNSSQDKYGWWDLKKGAYKVRTNEIINLPTNLVALAFSRTSLLRMGAFTQNGVWDAGFKGCGEFILVIENSYGIKLKENARIVQLVFFRTDETEEYNGIYKNLK